MSGNASKIIRPEDLGLYSDSFVTIENDRLTPRRIMNVEGGQKSGKTSWCLKNLPGPIIVYNFDNGLEGVAEKFMKEKTIIPAGIALTKEQTAEYVKRGIKPPKYPSYHFMRPIPQAGETATKTYEKGGDGKPELSKAYRGYLERVKKCAVPYWEKFVSDYTEGLKSSARSLVVDTGGHAFQLAKFAFLGMDKATTKDDPYGQKGGEMKSIFQGLLIDGYNYDKNVVWTHRLKEEWAGGQPTGTFKLDGYAQVSYEVELTLRVKRVGSGEDTEFLGEIRDCRLGNGARNNGMKFGGEDNPPLVFSTIMSMLTGMDEEEFE